MLAHHVQWYMRQAWSALMFADEDQAGKLTRDLVAPAKRPEAAMKKLLRRTLEDGAPPGHSFQTLLRGMAAVVRNTCRTANSARDAL